MTNNRERGGGPPRKETEQRTYPPMARLERVPEGSGIMPDRQNLVSYLNLINAMERSMQLGTSVSVKWSGKGTDVRYESSLGTGNGRKFMWPPRGLGSPVESSPDGESNKQHKKWTKLRMQVRNVSSEPLLEVSTQVSIGDTSRAEARSGRHWLDSSVFQNVDNPITVEINGIVPSQDEINKQKEEQKQKFAGAREERDLQTRITRQRAESIYRLYDDESGVWEPEVLIGADTEEELQRAAMMTSFVLSRGPYQFLPTRIVADTKEEVVAREVREDVVKGFMSGEVFADFFQLPQEELDGFERYPVPDYKINLPPERELTEENSITIGDILDNSEDVNGGRPKGPYQFGLDDLKNVLIAGSTRSGKTEAGMTMTEALVEKGVTVTVIAANAGHEWKGWAARLAENNKISDDNKKVFYIKPDQTGDKQHLSVGIDLFKPAEGFPDKEHARRIIEYIISVYEGESEKTDYGRGLLRSCLSAAVIGGRVNYKASDGQLFRDDFIGALADHGVNQKTGVYEGRPEDKTSPSLEEVLKQAFNYVDKIGYAEDGKVKQDVQGFLERALGELQTTDFFNAQYKLPPEELLHSNVIIDLADIQPRVQGLVMGAVSLLQEEQAKVEQDARGESVAQKLHHANYFGEGGLLLQGEGSVTEGIISKMYTQTVKYGFTNIIETQNLADLNKAVLNNVHSVMIGKLKSPDEIKRAGDLLHLTPSQRDLIWRFEEGVMLASSFHAPDAIRIRTPDPTGKTSRMDKVVSPAEGLVHAGPTGEYYTAFEYAEAEKFLDQNAAGKIAVGWSDVEIMSAVYNLGYLPLKDFSTIDDYDPLSVYKRMADPENGNWRRIISCAIEQAVTSQVLVREKEIRKLKTISTTDLIRRVCENMCGQLGITLPNYPRASEANTESNKVPTPYKYALLLRDLSNTMRSNEAKGIDDTEPYAGTNMYESYFGHKIPGNTVREQYIWMTEWQSILENITKRDGPYVSPALQARFSKTPVHVYDEELEKTVTRNIPITVRIREMLEDGLPNRDDHQPFYQMIDDVDFIEYQEKKFIAEQFLLPRVTRAGTTVTPIEYPMDQDAHPIDAAAHAEAQILKELYEDFPFKTDDEGHHISVSTSDKAKEIVQYIREVQRESLDAGSWLENMAFILEWFAVDKFTRSRFLENFGDVYYPKLEAQIKSEIEKQPVTIYSVEQDDDTGENQDDDATPEE